MMYEIFNRYIVIFLYFFTAVFPRPVLAAESNVNITASVPGCGDSIIQIGEECDGSNLDGETCQDHGFLGGTLSCDSSCFFNTSSCTNVVSEGGGGGGGGGGGIIIPPKFFPKNVDINRDGKVNIVDLSILLYYYGRSLEIPSRVDFNEDGKVDLIDISILLYYWTE